MTGTCSTNLGVGGGAAFGCVPRETTCETLRRRKPGSSVSEGSAPSPCRSASMRAALPLAAAAAPGCRERGEECRESLCRSEHRAPLAAREADLKGVGRRSTRTASGASAAVARRAARRARFCSELLLRMSRCLSRPTGESFGILNSRTAPLRYPRSRIRYQNVKRTKAEKVSRGDKITVRTLRRFCDLWGAKTEFFELF